MTDERDFHERRRSDHEGTVTARLERIERKLDEVVKQQDRQAIEIRDLRDWKIEMTVYVRQARWTLLAALGAMIGSAITAFLSWPH